MRILVDISHPAHVHFFRNAIGVWRHHGHDVVLYSRDKDITQQLMAAYRLEGRCLSRMRSGKWNLVRELCVHNSRLANEVRRSRPDIMLQIGGTFVAPVGYMCRVPSLVFSDTEMARASNRISFPFASAVITPDCYSGWAPENRHYVYAGYHELAYLHPHRFQADPRVFDRLGIKPDEPYSIVRFVSWGASHDVGESGFSQTNKIQMVHELAKHGRVFITSEGQLPAELESFRFPIPPEWIHHALAFAQFFVGESSTMASEAAVLGVPAIFVSTSPRGYTDEQEQRYGLVANFSHTEQDQALATLQDWLQQDDRKKQMEATRNRLLTEKIDVTDWLVRLVEGYPSSLETLCRKPYSHDERPTSCAA